MWRLRGRAPTDAEVAKPRHKKHQVGEAGADTVMEEEEAEGGEENEDSNLLLKSHLQLHQQQRALAAGLWVTCLVSSQTALCKLSDGAGRKYDEEVKKQGPGHTLGSPHTHKVMAAWEGMAQDGGEELVDTIKIVLAALEAQPQACIGAAFPHSVAKPCRGKGKAAGKGGTNRGEGKHKLEFKLDPFHARELEIEAPSTRAPRRRDRCKPPSCAT